MDVLRREDASVDSWKPLRPAMTVWPGYAIHALFVTMERLLLQEA